MNSFPILNSFFVLVLLGSCLIHMPLLGADNNPPPPKIPKLDIRLTHKGFKTDPESFLAVCNSAAMAIARYYPKRQFKPILIPKANNGFPVKLDQRGPEGEPQILLSIDDGWGWAQIAYQFSHEFTHILINHDQPRAGPNHWINEAFCEAVSYQSLKQWPKTGQATRLTLTGKATPSTTTPMPIGIWGKKEIGLKEWSLPLGSKKTRMPCDWVNGIPSTTFTNTQPTSSIRSSRRTLSNLRPLLS